MPVFDAMNVCLHPSRADAFPTTLLEAMAASVPVIASAVGGIPEIVEDGREGILVPAPPTPTSVADAIRTLILDPRRRDELADAGRRRYEASFTADLFTARTRALYESVVAERAKRR
jgi:glycosyltransferase involved in cell wall biosynthesis